MKYSKGKEYESVNTIGRKLNCILQCKVLKKIVPGSMPNKNATNMLIKKLKTQASSMKRQSIESFQF
jgi:hypothetical protein